MSPRSAEQFEKIRTDRKEAIMESALKIFAEESYHATSVSRIAKDAGISKGLMYNYFDSKEELLNELIVGVMDRLIKRFAMPEEGELTNEEFERFIDLSFDVIQEDPLHMKLFFSLMMQPKVTELMMEKLMAKVAPFMQLMHGYFERAGHDNPMSAMRYFSACVDGIQMHLVLDNAFPIDDAKAMLKKQFLNEK
jgi:AcrR family transcriptional regulator